MKNTNTTYEQLVKKANAEWNDKLTMPKISDIAELLKEKNIAHKLWNFQDGEYYLEIFDACFTMKNKSAYYSKNTKYYAQNIVKLIK